MPSQEVVDRFIRYAKIHTTSISGVGTFPSTQGQFDLARLLVQELKDLGLSDAEVDEKCVVYATLPSTLPEFLTQQIPTICFSSHLDTSSDVSGENVQPRVLDYAGGDITYPKNPDLVIKAESIPSLKNLVGTQLITSDGTTLLGADDKAGIAEIMTALTRLKEDPSKKHGIVKILFSPDEEIGTGSEAVDLDKVGADFAYTVDGGEMGGLDTECFSAAGGTITITGYNVHPGTAFGKMQNSLRLIPEVLALFPAAEAPETTQGHQAYYHPGSIEGKVGQTALKFILRSFDSTELDALIAHIQEGIQAVQQRHPEYKISVDISKSYRNMKEILDNYPKIVEIAKRAIIQTGLQVIENPIRGGTDGARFSFRGMPTPNIFTGGYNYHSKKEFVSVLGMTKAVETIVNIISLVTEIEK